MKTHLLLTALLSSFLTIRAAVITSTDTQKTFYVVADDDLLQTALSSSTISGFDPASGYVPNEGDIFNGSFDVASYTFGRAYIDNSTGSIWTYDFTLDLSANTAGYDITAIDSYSGWNSVLASQDYKIEYSLVGSSDYVELGTFTESATDTALKVSITENNTGILASGVDAIRFTHLSDGTNDNRGSYRELDVFGTPTVIPEPGTALLMSLSGLVLLLIGRRHRS